jgi:hypothetical protein
MIRAVPLPQVLNRIEASLQYPAEIGSVAEAWLSDWIGRHGANINLHPSNGHELLFLVPAHAEGCTTQLNVEYHFTHASADDFEAHAEEIRQAIYVGAVTPFAAASCDAFWSTDAE